MDRDKTKVNQYRDAQVAIAWFNDFKNKKHTHDSNIWNCLLLVASKEAVLFV